MACAGVPLKAEGGDDGFAGGAGVGESGDKGGGLVKGATAAGRLSHGAVFLPVSHLFIFELFLKGVRGGEV